MESGEAVTVQPAVSLHGFQFHTRCQKIDWRKIAAVDIDKVAREVDVETLQVNINHLTYCDIENEVDATTVDPNFIKLFKLAQLSIEFLIHSQDSLLQSLSEAEEQLVEVNRSLEEERKFRICDRESIRQLQRENRKRRRIIENQQLEMLHGDKLARCGAAHVVRRHPGQTAPTEDMTLHSWGGTPPNRSTPDLTDLPKEIHELRNLLRAERSELLRLTAQLQNLPPKTESTPNCDRTFNYREDPEKEQLRCELERLRQKYNELAHNAQHSPFTATEGAVQDVNYCRLSSPVLCDKEVQTAPNAISNGILEQRLSQQLEYRLSQQLEQQKMEMTRFLTKQELAFQESVNALSRDLVCLSKTSMNLEQKLSQLESPGSPARLPTRAVNNLALGGNKSVRLVAPAAPEPATLSSHRFPQGTASGPMPVPRQRVVFHSKSVRKPSMFVPSYQDSSMHVKNNVSKGSYEIGQPTRQFLFDNKTMKERMKSAVRSTPNLIDALKEEIMDLTKNKLSSMGVNLENPVTNTIFRDCSRKLKSERRLLAKRDKHFFELRTRASQEAEKAVNQIITEGSRKPVLRYESNLSLGSVEEPAEPVPLRCDTKNTSGMSNISTTSSDDEKDSAAETNRVDADSSRMYSVRYNGREAGTTSPEITKPLISSDDDEDCKAPEETRINRAPSSRGPREKFEAKSRPPTRISDLVQSIESQLLKRTSRPPKGSVDLVEFKEAGPKSLHAGDQHSLHPLIKKDDVPVTPSPGGATKDRASLSQNYSDDDDAESLDEVN
ncbi:cilium assembly protein DZIP1-like isoform X2 [Ornithodoros turicata]|uniref:cilium assembly protein DZIP1-like isoform X2 n=1 Tax=Ornithodoros turicata TaxID=34597 RepID=UPI003138D5DD